MQSENFSITKSSDIFNGTSYIWALDQAGDSGHYLQRQQCTGQICPCYCYFMKTPVMSESHIKLQESLTLCEKKIFFFLLGC